MNNKQFLYVLLPLLGTVLLLGYCTPPKKANVAEETQVKKWYSQHIEKLDTSVTFLKNAVTSNTPTDSIRLAFKKTRLAYKKIEFLAELYNPYTAKALNGPPINEVEEDDPLQKIVAPTGFQVIEEILFPTYDTQNKGELLRQIGVLQAGVNRLRQVTQTTELTNSNVFEAMRKETFRIITLGISGFDSPVAMHAMPEAAAAIGALQEVFAIYQPNLASKNPELSKQLQNLFTASIRYLQENENFTHFDRALFITKYANALSTSLLDVQYALQIPVNSHLQALSPTIRTLFDSSAFDPNFYTPDYESHVTTDRVELGKMLFFDPVLSGNGSRSCASCHNPQKAFTDGKKKSIAFNFKGEIARNAPTILNAGLQRSLFHDSRVVFLEDQASDVLVNEVEMHGSLEKAVKQLSESPEYYQLFTKAFPKAADAPITEGNLKIAIASYVRSLSSLNSRFDQYMRGDQTILSAIEKTGFNLFMGKAKCATCHFMPLFNGTVPPTFDHSETEIIGVPVSTDTLNPVLDPDMGKFALFNINLHKFAFKTPTVRNIALTAPYMHNGVYETLEEVVDFYNKGGGQGLGIDLPTQTLPADPLNLTKEEKEALVAFMQALTDTSMVKNVPERLPAFPAKMALNNRKVGGKY